AAAIYELGLRNLQLSPGPGSSPEVQRRFESGLVELMQRRGLYVEDPKGVEITEGVLYRAHIAIPARVPVGNYTAETFLIKDGRVLAGATRDIRIEKLGFERVVAQAARSWSLAYGIVAVALSLLLGWGASIMFRRR
ncbi:MAG TPA: TIGR02186 family protein, partial [Allosphingosinicella sp.]|nr:TIGR02186 family protein [Allosphingosinicella sp.]